MTDEEIYQEATPYSIMGHKLRALIAAARTCADVPGCVVEVGVYKGGSGLALCRCFPDRTVLLLDTFTGIPENDELKGGHFKGDFHDTSWSKVWALLESKFCKATLLSGDICTKLARITLEPHQYAFIHLDCDTHQSTRAAVDLLVPRLAPGGGVFFDDYGHPECPGVKPIVDELAASGRFIVAIAGETAFLKLRA